ncbi:protein suppressor of hairy wing [Lucilia cuprina]|uniref:protein suppressor of hairy wing n=1 Tax=Lucilia cuprina TaxID=7375 RepID=UPI000C7198BD|nr:protein suppressor of hairy wing [Lucilia cuprina]XP_046805696.1 protein suppressor of hairy wing [Lucilia cuprina]KAI8123113.1 Protein suppressor of hairy wing [Lucilia cuprina]
MSTKEGKSKTNTRNSSTGIKILNDEKITPVVPLKIPVMTSVPLSPPKQMTLSIAKPKKAMKQRNMDHYVMKTVKGEKNTDTGMEESETIDFILADNNDDELVTKPSGEITEELHLSDDDDEHEMTFTGSTQEIVEHVCGKCYKTFRRIKSLKKHLDYCRFDSGYHIRKAEMLKNLEKIEKDAIIMENKDVCFCCGESYDTFHLGHINCPDCPKSFKTQMSYERHIFITHSEFDDHPCSICNAKLRSANLLKLHEEQHRNRGKPFACKICGKDFTRSYHLSRHQKYSSCSANENDTMHCKVCNKAFYRLDNLRAHLKQHLGTQTTKKSEYMCPICKKCFYSLSTLNIHTRTHTGEKPFDCDLCEKKFPSLVALKKHRRYHTGEKPYTCSVCKQCFAVKEVLNRHMKRHTGERPHVCSECGKSFIQGTQLRTHIKVHLRPYECDQCPEKYRTEKQLEKHMKEHTATKRKGRTRMANKCLICKKGFKTELEFNNHMQMGNHTTPAQRRKMKSRTDCAVCKEDFDSVQSLQFHILKVHQEDPETFVNEDPFETSTRVRNNEDSLLMPAPKVIKIEDAQGQRIEFVTTNSEGKILNTNVQGLNEKQILSTEGKTEDSNKVQILEQYIIDDTPSTSANAGSKQTIFLTNEAYTVIPLESDGGIIEPITTNTLPSNIISPECKKEQRKTLAESLAAAIADDDETDLSTIDEEPQLSEEELKLKDNVSKLLDMLVDGFTLKKFGWPDISEETVLCKVIENCGHDLTKDQYNYSGWDYASRMREYVKLLFTVVIHNDSIKELLNNYPIDEVIEYVLGNDDEDDDDEEDDNTNKSKDKGNEETVTIKRESGD